MEKTTHTPGPWAIGTFNDIYATRTDSRLATVIGAREGNQDALANAHLIAAAPQLLRELKSAIFYIETYGGEVTTSFASGGNLRAIKQLIAEAEGRD